MTVKLDPKNLAEAVRRTRKAAGLSRQELAELAGVGKTFIFDLEKAQGNSQLGHILKVLRVLNIKIHLEEPG